MFALVFVFFTGAVRAAAQITLRNADASVGYQLLHIPDETFPFGLNVDASVQLIPNLKVAGEFGWARDTQTEAGVRGTLNFINLGAGPRFELMPVSAGTSRIRPFVQLLVGAVHADANLEVAGVTLDTGDWAFMLQPGAGVVVPLTPMIGVLGQFDYRRAFFEGGENEFRFVAGVRLGGR